ncbi:MAG: hypothetical protein M1818_005663 [Claussenomyces sp. TS43310]|nr:MAG: hypothetical protein M1818_005663 [Claussenomyces sp. TS43310]
MAGQCAPFQISASDLEAFHIAHFSTTSTSHFATQFLGPVSGGEAHVAEADDDGLGYYDDGTKRTLTDEQVAMFRHSEIHALLKKRLRAEEAQTEAESPIEFSMTPTAIVDGVEAAASDAALLPTATDERESQHPSRGHAKKGRKARKGAGARPVKPDLRKRTWDMVDKGLDGLDYGDVNSPAARAPNAATQRKRISYDDD